MAMPQLQEAASPHGSHRASPTSKETPGGTQNPEYPVREYIAGMARELAQMARWDGDEGLAALLEAAVIRAQDQRP